MCASSKSNPANGGAVWDCSLQDSRWASSPASATVGQPYKRYAGVGLSSVYALTDLAVVVSGDSLYMFDPSGQHLQDLSQVFIVAACDTSSTDSADVVGWQAELAHAAHQRPVGKAHLYALVAECDIIRRNIMYKSFGAAVQRCPGLSGLYSPTSLIVSPISFRRSFAMASIPGTPYNALVLPPGTTRTSTCRPFAMASIRRVEHGPRYAAVCFALCTWL
jgi:hypothetical protein